MKHDFYADETLLKMVRKATELRSEATRLVFENKINGFNIERFMEWDSLLNEHKKLEEDIGLWVIMILKDK